MTPQFLHVVRAPAQVIAYHGCHQETARHLLQSNPFVHSANAYDWLGEGIYFWEYAPHRAWEWAQAKFGEEAAVLQSRISLGHCLNLLDTAYFEGLQMAYQIVVQRYAQEGRRSPLNRADKRHFLD